MIVMRLHSREAGDQRIDDEVNRPSDTVARSLYRPSSFDDTDVRWRAGSTS
jgi:hypothetical protein